MKPRAAEVICLICATAGGPSEAIDYRSKLKIKSSVMSRLLWLMSLMSLVTRWDRISHCRLNKICSIPFLKMRGRVSRSGYILWIKNVNITYLSLLEAGISWRFVGLICNTHSVLLFPSPLKV